MNFRPFSLFFLTLCLLCSTGQALAEKTLQLSNMQEVYPLAPWIDILEDPSGKLTIDDVIREPYASQFTPNRHATPNFGFSNSAFWVRLRVRNDAIGIPQWLLEQHYTNTHRLDLYHPDTAGQGFIKHASGNLLPLHQRDVPHRRIVFKFPLPAGEEQTLYLRLKNGSSSTIDLHLWQPEAFAADDLREIVWLGLFAGTMLFFLCYNLLMWLAQRDRNYLWQALFVSGTLATFAFYKGYAQILLPAEAVYWSQYATPLFFPVTIIAILSFIHSFLPPKDANSWRQRSHKWHLRLWIALILVIPFMPYVAMVKILTPLCMAYLVYILVWAILAWREKIPSARLFLTGWSVFLLAVLLVLAVRIGWVEPNIISESRPVQLSLIWLVLFSALAQASRVHHLMQQSERTNAALQQSENQRHLAMQIGRIGTWSFDLTSQKIDCDPEAASLLQLTDATLTGRFDEDYATLRRHIHSDDWENLITRAQASLRDKVPFSAEFRTRHDHEEPRWLEVYGEMPDAEDQQAQLLHGTLQDITERKQRALEVKQSEETLRAIASAVSAAIGEAFFRELALSIARLFDIDHVVIGLVDDNDPKRIHTVALCIHGKIRNNISYSAANGPCDAVINGEFRTCSDGMRTQFPDNELLTKLNADSCVAAPLLAYYGKPLGLIAVLNAGSIDNGKHIQSILRIFAVRASAEVQRLKTEQQLQATKQRLTQHIRDTPLAVIEINNQFKFTAWNPAAERIFGFTAEEAIGQTAELLLPKGEKPAIDPIWDGLMTQSGGAHSVNRNITKDGQILICEWHNTPLLAADGEVIGVASLVNDISKQVAVQKELTQHRAHLEELVSQRSAEIQEQARILDQVHDAVIATDLQGHVTYWNLGASRRLGYTPEEAMGQFIGFIHSKTDPMVLPQVLKKLEKNGQLERELQIRCKDGSLFSAHLSLSMRYDSNNRPCGTIGIILDISERKQAETELEKQRLALKNTNRELEAFSYSVSHDLRAPLRALNGFSQALLEDYGAQLDDTARDYIQRLRSATLRMSERIDSLLALSRLSRSTLQREDIDLSVMAQEIMQQLEEREPQRQVNWTIKPNIRAHADAALLNAVLDNLLSNAWKYTAKTEAATITFEARQTKQGYAYIVTDNGAGFDMRHADKLFAPFQRLHNETEFPGSGVGLATVARIIHRHGGEVWAEAEINKGASFYFTLP